MGPKRRDKEQDSIPQDVLDDLCSRFIVNVPLTDESSGEGQESTPSSTKLCYQLELAYWFYLDFERQDDPTLPSLNFRDFSVYALNHVHSLRDYVPQIDRLVKEWRSFKSQVPTYGCIMLESDLKYVLLVQGFTATGSWGFPKGKVNQGEPPHECAARETEEETGFNVEPFILQDQFIERDLNGRKARMYFAINIPFETEFKTKCRGEIRDIRWFPLDGLPRHKNDVLRPQTVLAGMTPSQFFMVIPFVSDIMAWLRNRKSPNAPQPSTPKSAPVNIKKKGGANKVYENDSAILKKSLKKELTGSSEQSPSVSGLFSMFQPLNAAQSPSRLPGRGMPAASTPPRVIAPIVTNAAATGVLPHIPKLNSSQLSAQSDALEFDAPSWVNFKVDMKSVMMAWDGWPGY